MFKHFIALAAVAACSHAFALGSVENPQPNATESGIAVISGWYCQQATITIQIDNGTPFAAPYGSLRADTAGVCGGRIATGFSYLINYNTLAAGAHTLVAFADGAPFGSVAFKTTNLGAEFLTGKAGEYWLNNFPDYGTRSRLTWQESKQNFVITGSDTNVPAIGGTFYGAIVATYAGCTNSGSNGSFFEVDRFIVNYGSSAQLTLEAANTGQTCTYTGTAYYTTAGGDITVPSGTFSCVAAAGQTAGGTWSSDRIVFDPLGLLVNLSAKYTTGETCQLQGHLGGAR